MLQWGKARPVCSPAPHSTPPSDRTALHPHNPAPTQPHPRRPATAPQPPNSTASGPLRADPTKPRLTELDEPTPHLQVPAELLEAIRGGATRSLYVCNVPEAADESSVARAFAPFGELESVQRTLPRTAPCTLPFTPYSSSIQSSIHTSIHASTHSHILHSSVHSSIQTRPPFGELEWVRRRFGAAGRTHRATPRAGLCPSS
jgi:hypothetical protein